MLDRATRRKESKIIADMQRYKFADIISRRKFLKPRVNRLLAAMLLTLGLMIGTAAAATFGTRDPAIVAIGRP